ncbi:MAG: TIGR01440 family protein [Clostridia bacterium]|nr:TIGR01440 family protein [Clostridia bacterium]
MLQNIKEQAKTAVTELLDAAKLEKGDIFVVGCSSSEVIGSKLGTASSYDVAKAVFDGIYPVLKERGIYIASQCCEHINRALVIERELADSLRLQRVNVIPQIKAGGSFSTVTYESLDRPCMVENISAQAGMDIGGVLIGMHLQQTAVPVRLSLDHIGEAILICARTRPKFVGGVRAVYDESLL